MSRSRTSRGLVSAAPVVFKGFKLCLVFVYILGFSLSVLVLNTLMNHLSLLWIAALGVLK